MGCAAVAERPFDPGLMRMKRDKDLDWFIANRDDLARNYQGSWLIVHDGKLIRVLPKEEDALAFAVENFGIDEASVFLASVKDPFIYVG